MGFDCYGPSRVYRVKVTIEYDAWEVIDEDVNPTDAEVLAQEVNRVAALQDRGLGNNVVASGVSIVRLKDDPDFMVRS